eukprot:TRINITY_DN42221_c0_g1_i1.p1 TRINITY_DN42221_c0_g1~~TRINITY_DN42221_c0_g1_i1.p1  ORF type:complete len:262 (+),score=44.33 TRINITY_DN42221_c0_g1_i1:50-835(+)
MSGSMPLTSTLVSYLITCFALDAYLVAPYMLFVARPDAPIACLLAFSAKIVASAMLVAQVLSFWYAAVLAVFIGCSAFTFEFVAVLLLSQAECFRHATHVTQETILLTGWYFACSRFADFCVIVPVVFRSLFNQRTLGGDVPQPLTEAVQHVPSFSSDRSAKMRFQLRQQLNDASVRTCEWEEVCNSLGEEEAVSVVGTCCICLDEFQDRDLVTELSCHHVFHESCVEAWIASRDASLKSRRIVCPLRCLSRGSERTKAAS